MTREQFERELNYQTAVSIARILFVRGLISVREYGKIDTILIKKHRPLLGGLRT
jgi:hypothetical protein